jgi:F-type H+-transporting ATPase subunit alpha
MPRFEAELFDYVETKHPQALTLLREKRELTNDVKAQLNSVLEEFKGRFVA